MRLGGRRRRSRWSGCESCWLLLGIGCRPKEARIVPMSMLEGKPEHDRHITYLWKAIGMGSDDSNIPSLRVGVVYGNILLDGEVKNLLL